MPAREPLANQQRVQRILRQARREVGLRDLITFSLGRIWQVLLSLAAAVHALIVTSQFRDEGHEKDSPPTGDAQP